MKSLAGVFPLSLLRSAQLQLVNKAANSEKPLEKGKKIVQREKLQIYLEMFKALKESQGSKKGTKP